MWRIISYASRSLTDVERRYSQTENEALALVWACERFRMYVSSQSLELETDHKITTSSRAHQNLVRELRDGCYVNRAMISRWSSSWQRKTSQMPSSGIQLCASNRRELHTRSLVGKKD